MTITEALKLIGNIDKEAREVINDLVPPDYRCTLHSTRMCFDLDTCHMYIDVLERETSKNCGYVFLKLHTNICENKIIVKCITKYLNLPESTCDNIEKNMISRISALVITKDNQTFHYTLHQRLWNILADNPGMNKERAINNFFTKEERIEFGNNGCVTCTYTNAISECDNCDNCPLDTSNVQVDEFMERVYDEYGVDCLKKLYMAWDVVTNALAEKDDGKLKEQSSKYARMIANLPVKEGVPFD